MTDKPNKFLAIPKDFVFHPDVESIRKAKKIGILSGKSK